jgi:hypothetical protein
MLTQNPTDIFSLSNPEDAPEKGNRNTVLDETAAKWCLAAMNTVACKTRLWWRTS